jgi:hypothetical protein
MLFTKFEPKVAFRHKLIINGITAYVCKAVNMPQLDQGGITIDYINTDFKVKGKSRWQDITITLYDPVDPSAAKEVHDWIKIHHNSESGIDGFAFDDYKKDITIQALDPKGSPVETWTVHGAFISAVNWGQMDWATDEAKTIELTMKYDYAVLS